MIVVVEGPDGAGKTTFCEIIVAEGVKLGLQAERVHAGPPPPGMNLTAHYLSTIQRGASRDMLIVADRLHLGELIYGHTRREGSRLTWFDMCALSSAIVSTPGHQFILIPPMRTINARLKDRGEHHPRLDDECFSFGLIGHSLGAGATVLLKTYSRAELKKIAKETVGKLHAYHNR